MPADFKTRSGLMPGADRFFGVRRVDQQNGPGHQALSGQVEDASGRGRADAEIVSSVPHGVVRSFFAGPEISRYSPHYGEALKGIAVGVSLEPTRRPVRVVVRLRQVCAQYFRNSFLYY